MIIVIDAYNLLRATPPYKKTITEKERVQFIVQLSSYGRNKGHKIVIVFDGGPHEWPFRENMKTVQIVYSGMHESADDYIKEYLEIHKEKDLLLVSSDNELNRYAQYRTIASIDSVVFSRLLYEYTREKKGNGITQYHEAVKLVQDKEFSCEAQNALDQLMRESSKKIFEKSEDFARNREVKKEQVSKHDRALLKKLKKL